MPESVRGDDGGGVVRYDFPFSQIPEWILFHPGLSDRAVRLYGVILRFGNSSGRRIPGRARLAKLCRECSVDSVDRAKAELVAVGAIEVERRFVPGASVSNADRTNVYTVHALPPGSRTDAATSRPGSRTDAAGVAAEARHYRERTTDRERGPESEPVDNSGDEAVSEAWSVPVDFVAIRAKVRGTKAAS
jgi:hypothetical protein